MRTQLAVAVAGLGLFLVAAAPVSAHHAFAAEFEFHEQQQFQQAALVAQALDVRYQVTAAELKKLGITPARVGGGVGGPFESAGLPRAARLLACGQPTSKTWRRCSTGCARRTATSHAPSSSWVSRASAPTDCCSPGRTSTSGASAAGRRHVRASDGCLGVGGRSPNRRAASGKISAHPLLGRRRHGGRIRGAS